MVVRRDLLPDTVGLGSSVPDQSGWLSGQHWLVWDDWTSRAIDGTGTVNESGRMMAGGMGSPFSPGPIR